jgi:hypothetical protein
MGLEKCSTSATSHEALVQTKKNMPVGQLEHQQDKIYFLQLMRGIACRPGQICQRLKL